QQLHPARGIQCLEPCLDMLGLPQGQAAFAGGDDDALGRGTTGFDTGHGRETHARRTGYMPEAVFRRSAASGLTPMARWLAAILACMPLALRAAPLELPAPRNLQLEAVEMARSDEPMVVLYSQSGCHWCEEARTYLVPMSREEG